jgi:alkanesulfonate monooxygenase SsuD/methylene tetrahydromethanopterin reductase-like flavin-dependent oxidoreductase (luciferase family)
VKAVAGRVTFGFKTSPQHVSFATLDETWAAAAELPVFVAAWMNDHFSDPAAESGGPSFESLTLMAALAHRVPGAWLGHSVLANTFRHPALLAKAATTMDHVTGGRFIVGLGMGWHTWEHEAFGVSLPPPRERFERLISTVRVPRALGSPAAAAAPGVTLDDAFAPLRGATNEPPPLTPGGPPIFLGGQGPRGLRLAAEEGDGWFIPSIPFTGPEVFAARRDAILRAMEAAGRDPDGFQFVAQVGAGGDAAARAEACELALAYARAGATHVGVAVPSRLGPAALIAAAREVAEPAAAALG